MNTGSSGRSVEKLPPCGTFISNTMIVMMIAITPSLNASSRFRPMRSSARGSRMLPRAPEELSREHHVTRDRDRDENEGEPDVGKEENPGVQVPGGVAEQPEHR